MGLPPIAEVGNVAGRSRRRSGFGCPSALGRRQALGLLMALLVLAGGRVVRQELLVGPDGAWRSELWLDAVLEPDATFSDVANAETGSLSVPATTTAMDPGTDPAPGAVAGALRAGEPPQRAAASRRKDGPAAPLPINTCSVDSLQMLPGVGPVMAGRIDAARRQGVVFRNPAALLGIKGIGPATVSRLTPLLDFRNPAPVSPKPVNPH